MTQRPVSRLVISRTRGSADFLDARTQSAPYWLMLFPFKIWSVTSVSRDNAVRAFSSLDIAQPAFDEKATFLHDRMGNGDDMGVDALQVA